jgi:hypothetical protein
VSDPLSGLVAVSSGQVALSSLLSPCARPSVLQLGRTNARGSSTTLALWGAGSRPAALGRPAGERDRERLAPRAPDVGATAPGPIAPGALRAFGRVTPRTSGGRARCRDRPTRWRPGVVALPTLCWLRGWRGLTGIAGGCPTNYATWRRAHPRSSQGTRWRARPELVRARPRGTVDSPARPLGKPDAVRDPPRPGKRPDGARRGVCRFARGGVAGELGALWSREPGLHPVSPRSDSALGTAPLRRSTDVPTCASAGGGSGPEAGAGPGDARDVSRETPCRTAGGPPGAGVASAVGGLHSRRGTGPQASLPAPFHVKRPVQAGRR